MQASDFAPLIADCCSAVLEGMYFTSVLESRHETGETTGISGGVQSFSLRFQGDIQGTFGLQVGAGMARTLASNFLGEDENALSEEEISQVVGELANMLCGSVVSRVEGESKFILTHPEPAGPNAWVEQRLPTLVTALETDNGLLQTWICLDSPSSSVALEAAQAGRENT